MKNSFLIKDLPVLERPRERLEKYGCESLNNEELLDIILKTGYKNSSVKEVSNILLKEIEDIRNLKDISINKLTRIKGIGKVKAITLIAAIELGKRVYINNNSYNILDSSDKIYNYIKYDLIDKKQEYFISIYLDSKKNIINKKTLFIGTLNRSLVHPREIFKYAYINSCSSIVLVHNHPSGDVIPSKEDILLTKKIVEIGNIQGINVIDHIIVGNNNYYSFFDNGDM